MALNSDGGGTSTFRPAGTQGMTLAQVQAMLDSQGNAAMAGAGGANGKINPNSIIYMGPGKMGSTLGNRGPNYGISQGGPLVGIAGNQPDNWKYSDAKLLPVQWMESDPDKLKQLINNGILRKVPGFDPGMGMPEVLDAWDNLVQAAFAMNQANPNGKQYTPWDVLNTYSNEKGKYGTVRKGDWEYDIATGEKVRYVGPKTKTQTDKRIDLSSAEDVRALTTQVLTQALGRAPTAKEVAQYKATINAQEQANPTLTTQTQHLNDMGEVVNTETNTSGGLGAEAKAGLVQTQAQKGPEYGKYQSGTTYWNAMMQMIAGG